MKKIIVEDLKEIDYKKAWDYQEQRFNEIIQAKIENKNNPEKEPIQTINRFLFCEHPHVYTLGKSGSEENLLINQIQLAAKDAVYYKINRGGDITYHGPGQIVGYPILDLDHFFSDIHKYIRYLEECIIRVIAEYGLEGNRIQGASGVWLDIGTPQERKICAIGVRTSRWVTMHGFAFNINTNLDYFNYINPCGFVDKGVTSLKKELGYTIDLNEVKPKILKHFSDLFEAEMIFLS